MKRQSDFQGNIHDRLEQIRPKHAQPITEGNRIEPADRKNILHVRLKIAIVTIRSKRKRAQPKQEVIRAAGFRDERFQEKQFHEAGTRVATEGIFAEFDCVEIVSGEIKIHNRDAAADVTIVINNVGTVVELANRVDRIRIGPVKIVKLVSIRVDRDGEIGFRKFLLFHVFSEFYCDVEVVNSRVDIGEGFRLEIVGLFGESKSIQIRRNGNFFDFN